MINLMLDDLCIEACENFFLKLECMIHVCNLDHCITCHFLLAFVTKTSFLCLERSFFFEDQRIVHNNRSKSEIYNDDSL